jgi:hypothetical protein
MMEKLTKEKELPKETRKSKRIRLYNALKAGYLRDEDKQQSYLKRFGYVLDRDLTEPRETVVAYNPVDNKLLYISNGTDILSPSDLANDYGIIVGNQETSNRTYRSKIALTKARIKYPEAKLTMAGHSLGGQILHRISPSSAKVTTYAPAFVPNQVVRPHMENYRTEGDVISQFSPAATTTVLPYVAGKGQSFPFTHDKANIKDEAIFL